LDYLPDCANQTSLPSRADLGVRSVSRWAIGSIVVAATIMLAGCRKTQSVTTTKPSTTPQLKADCEQASHKLLTIDHLSLRPELSIIGRLIEQAALAGEKIDAATTARAHRLSSSTYTAQVLADLAHSHAALQAVIQAVRRHGIAYDRLPRSLVLAFVKANSGCGRVSLRQPISG
jgi:hypothetical protein